jgi:hypothetical protein
MKKNRTSPLCFYNGNKNRFPEPEKATGLTCSSPRDCLKRRTQGKRKKKTKKSDLFRTKLVDQSVEIRLRAADVSHRHLRLLQLPTVASPTTSNHASAAAKAPPRFAEWLAYRVKLRPINLMEVLPSLISVRLDTAILGWGTNKPSHCLTTLKPKKWEPSPAVIWKQRMNSIKKFPTQRGLPSSTTKVRGVGYPKQCFFALTLMSFTNLGSRTTFAPVRAQASSALMSC